MTKQYLGDGVYVDYDGYALVLTAEHMRSVGAMPFVLVPEVYEALVRYVERLKVADALSAVSDGESE
jgi:hypothetical protein